MVQAIDTNLLDTADKGISQFLENARRTGRIDDAQFQRASRETFKNLKTWYTDESIPGFCPSYRAGIERWIKKGQEGTPGIWEDFVNAYRQQVSFGTGGIRGMMAFDKPSIVELAKEGLKAEILRGPNTINEIVLLLTSVGVAQYGLREHFQKVVVGFDSRVQGQALASLVAQLFLAHDYTVYLFDAPCPYPEVTFAIPYADSQLRIKADVGVFISASHNDYRYNGYKLSCANGSQFDPEQRNAMYNEYIRKAQPSQIKLCSFRDCGSDKLWFLGGEKPAKRKGFDYGGHEGNWINMHEKHQAHVRSFLLMKDLRQKEETAADPLHIAHCAFHGAGYEIVPDLLRAVGFPDVQPISGRAKLDKLDGLFPSFKSDKGHERQPDPGDPRAADIALKAYRQDTVKREKPQQFDENDIIIGTDPDADRCGITVRVPKAQEYIYGTDRYLLPADDVWTLLLWYRLYIDQQRHGKVEAADEKFVTMSHTTSDAIALLAKKFGIGVIKTWVGFAALAAATRDVWEGKVGTLLNLVEGRDEKYQDICNPFVQTTVDMNNGKRNFNIGALEQSNGFSILGGKPPDERSLGVGGHVRDKDGTFAALLVAEVAAWAKERGSNLIDLLDTHIFTDPEIGMFATFYEPDPRDGEYPGIEGDRIKRLILERAWGYYHLAKAGDLKIGGRQVKGVALYRTGKYDAIYPLTYDYSFPDEGMRFYFDDEKMEHATIRPSGTGNSLRFHIQLHAWPTKENLLETKAQLRGDGAKIMNDIRKLLRAPRRL